MVYLTISEFYHDNLCRAEDEKEAFQFVFNYEQHSICSQQTAEENTPHKSLLSTNKSHSHWHLVLEKW